MRVLAWRAGLVTAGGITLLAVLGAAGRAPSTYEASHMPEQDEKNLLAYAKPVLAAHQLDRKASPQEVQAALDVWMEEDGRGRLFSVAPSHLDDLADKGARGEILRARKNLSGLIQGLALRLEQKEPAAAARWYGDLIALNDIFKFSSPETMIDSNYYQHMAIKGLERMLPKLNAEQEAEAEGRVAKMVRPSEPLGPFALRINLAYRRVAEAQPERGSVVSNALRDLSTVSPEIVEAKGRKFSVVGSQEAMLKNISTGMYMALRSEQRVREEAATLAEQFEH